MGMKYKVNKNTVRINKKEAAKSGEQIPFDYANLVVRFKLAKSEETLDIMYKGSLFKAEKLLTGKPLIAAYIAIERALDRCQQDFDNSHFGLTRKINYTLKTQDSAKKYDPEKEMSRLLSDIS
ncbi:hypothetical protein KAM353_39270 [Aeromonas caviae]|nr:hypothetical protein KAM336_37320 [Aeromonas caviae]GJA29573.1 hypothetical protein KAM340_37400 [Aeromonas caviae]GJA74280.1 hypothetical protein KAM353_39270 [Aeromonas caviae]GJB04668.1 hypothetical protein KAM360_36110 [Aeromonas caviae]